VLLSNAVNAARSFAMRALSASLNPGSAPPSAIRLILPETFGVEMVLNKNLFVEGVLPSAVMRGLRVEEMVICRKPFANPGGDRRPTWSWPRQIPIEGRPVNVVKVVENYSRWLRQSDTPKLFVNADPGSILVCRRPKICGTWPNRTEITVQGTHFIQEDSPDEIGSAVADFIRRIRG